MCNFRLHHGEAMCNHRLQLPEEVEDMHALVIAHIAGIPVEGSGGSRRWPPAAVAWCSGCGSRCSVSETIEPEGAGHEDAADRHARAVGAGVAGDAREGEGDHGPRDALAAERRRMPWMAVENDYAFDGPDGRGQPPRPVRRTPPARRLPRVPRARRARLARSRLLGCSMVADQVAHVSHLHARDTTLVFASRARRRPTSSA